MISALVFEPMQPEALDWVVEEEMRLQESPWTRGNFEDSFACGHSLWRAYCDGEPAAYAVVMGVIDELHLLTIGVSTRFQRRGIGRHLLEHVCAQGVEMGAQQCLLEVRPSNGAAVSLYLDAGFLPIGKRRNYYPNADGSREDALVMRRAL